MEDLALVAVVVVALFFDFTNGFHDTANSIATSVSTRALSPRAAVLSAAVLNVLGAFVSLAVAATIASGIVDAEAITLDVVLAGLVGAITWNLVTWYLGLPSSSSHALIGGVLGSSIAAAGWGVVNWEGLKDKVLIPSLIAPFAGIVIAAALMIAITWVIRRRSPGLVNRVFRRLQLVSGGFVAFTHGTNDAQKTMGIIALALITSGHLAPGSDPPFWVIVSAAIAMGAGTYAGGWRIIKTLGTRIAKLDPPQGFAAQTRVCVDPLDDRSLRLSRLDDADDHGQRHGRRRLAAALGGALGRRRQHRRRLGDDDPVRRRGRSADGGRDEAAGRRRDRLRAGGGDRLDGVRGAALAGATARDRARLALSSSLRSQPAGSGAARATRARRSWPP